MVSGAKNPVFVESGRRGARKRWNGHAPVYPRLDDLTLEQRRLVVALIAAARNEKAATSVEAVAAESEGHANDRPAA